MSIPTIPDAPDVQQFDLIPLRNMGDDEIFERASNDFWPRIKPFAEDLKASTQWMMRALAIVQQGHSESTTAAQTATDKAGKANQSAQEADASKKAAAESAASVKQSADDAARANTESQAARDKSVAAEKDAKLWASQAQQLVTGDTPITSLASGELKQPKDYVSVDASGAVAVRNVARDVSEQLTRGDQAASFSRINYAAGEVTDVLDLNARRVFRLTGDDDTVFSLSLDNVPDANPDEAILVVVNIYGKPAVGWPEEWQDPELWDTGDLPKLGDRRSQVTALFDGVEWSLSLRIAK
ncbi:hypothetical protein [Vreelandella sp. EE22]